MNKQDTEHRANLTEALRRSCIKVLAWDIQISSEDDMNKLMYVDALVETTGGSVGVVYVTTNIVRQQSPEEEQRIADRAAAARASGWLFIYFHRNFPAKEMEAALRIWDITNGRKIPLRIPPRKSYAHKTRPS